MGYQSIRLESLKFLHGPYTLYRSLGFEEVPSYENNSMEVYHDQGQLEDYNLVTVFMQKDISN